MMRSSAILVLSVFIATPTFADDHDHGGAEAAKVERPKVFLDKSPRIVAYQLKRLNNQRLLLVERATDDAKYIPVYEAILSRPGMSPQFQEEAVAALAKLRETDAATELLSAINKIKTDNQSGARTVRGLAATLLKQPIDALAGNSALSETAADGDSELHRAVGYAGLLAAGKDTEAWEMAKSDDDSTIDLLAGIPLLPKPATRSKFRTGVVALIQDAKESDVKNAAIKTLASIPSDRAKSFDLIAPFVAQKQFRDAAVRTLLQIPKQDRSANACHDVATVLVKHAEDTPAKDRTSDEFIDAMQLADQLMGKLPREKAKAFRKRLNAVTVRVVKLRTVEEEMRYDVPYFAVEAGSDVQIVLENHDLMPHNLVVTSPGALKEIANLGLQVGPQGGLNGLPYVPKSEKVIAATEMLQPDKSERLTFTAPTEPGEYPYVCTFPQHWYRMYGVMVVVEDLDEWNQNPTEPKNPIGSNRSFIKAWTVDDLKDDLAAGIRGSSPTIGKKIFEEASCLGCHKVQGTGGVIGPELTDVFKRWKGDSVGVLREVLDPSHKVDAKYQMQLILTDEGKTYTGIVIKEDDDNVTLMANPEAKEPLLIPQDEIEEMLPAKNSMMPKALMDQFSKDEIFELMGYLNSVNPK